MEFSSVHTKAKPHAVCVPFQSQGHITVTLKLAKLLHLRGFHITFVISDHNQRSILRSVGPSALDGLPDFRFESIPDGLPPSDDPDAGRDIPSLCYSTQNTCTAPFRDLMARLNGPSSGVPPVTCVVADGLSSFTLPVTDELKIPNVFFWSPSASGFLSFLYAEDIRKRGIIPLKGKEHLKNGYLDTIIDWIPGLKKLPLKNHSSIMTTTDPDDIIMNFVIREVQAASRATAIFINTFHELEGPMLEALSTMLPPMYDIGPLCLLAQHISPESPLASMGLNVWKEDPTCMRWLDEKKEGSVLYVNYGSIAVLTSQQLVEFAWGLANSGCEFMWIIRPDLLMAGGDHSVLKELTEKIKGRSLIASWCPQEAVLAHRAVGGFLTHCGWNSTLESMSAGVPMLCWPFFADQQTNCWYLCNEWGIGMEVDGAVKREDVEILIKELMLGEKGRRMRERAKEWREIAVKRSKPEGESFKSLDKAIKEVMLAGEETASKQKLMIKEKAFPQ